MSAGLLVLFRRGAAVQLAGDRVGNVRELLLLLLKVLGGSGGGVVLEPVVDLLDGVQDGLLVILVNATTQALVVADLVLQAEGVVLQSVAGLDLALDGLVLLGELLGLSDHTVDFFLGQATLVVGDSDGLDLASSLVTGTDLQDTIGIQIERDLNLGNTTGGRRNAGKLELAEKVVVLGQRTLSLDCTSLATVQF